MKNPYIFLLMVPLAGCPVAHAYDVKEEPACVIDQCNENSCSVETPEGWVDIHKQPDYHEGKRIECPTWLIDPT